MTDQWFVMIPPSDKDQSSSEKELVDFVIEYPYPSAAWTAANAGQIVQGAEGNTGNPQVSEQLVKWQGPFATQAEAKTAAAAKQQSPNPLNDAGNAIETQTTIPGLAQIGDFFGALGQANTWIRVAKVVFGGALLVYGLAHITGVSGAAADAVRKLPLPI